MTRWRVIDRLLDAKGLGQDPKGLGKPLGSRSKPLGSRFVLAVAAWALLLAGLSGCVVVTVAPETPAAGATTVTQEAASPTSAPPAADVTRSPEAPAPTETLEPGRAPTRTLTPASPRRTPETLTPGASPAPTRTPTPALPRVDGRRSTVAWLRTPTPTLPRGTQDVFSPGASPAPQPGAPVGTVTTSLNIRGGPGSVYPVIGLLEPGQSVAITGASTDGGWWQIRLPAAAGRGWVSAAYITARNTQNVPIVEAPAPPATPPAAAVSAWRGEYFANRDLAGRPALVRDDPDVDFDWGAGPPADGLPVDGFSVRWTRDVNFSAASYRFYALVDDGVRLWIDGELVVDQWHAAAPTTYTADEYLADGRHTLVMEYYEHTGNAVAQLAWEPAQDYPDWKGEYYANPNLSGVPVLVRNETSLDFSWEDSPGPGVPADDFSARWTRSVYFPAYVYRFNLLVDDGARLWVDDRLIIDAWRAGPPDDFSAEIGLSEGPHNVRVEYFEFRYGAQLYLNWEPVRDGPAWEAEYFDNHRLKGDSVLEREDGLINFIWGDGSPGPGLPADNFSVRWIQDIDFEGGTYIFSVQMDDGARLWVDDLLLIDSWEEGRVRTRRAEHQLSPGTHQVRVEYFERTGHAQIEVTWELR